MLDSLMPSLLGTDVLGPCSPSSLHPVLPVSSLKSRKTGGVKAGAALHSGSFFHCSLFLHAIDLFLQDLASICWDFLLVESLGQ